MIFIKIGYHPIAGLAMAYASSLGGFGANFLIGMQDALVYAFTEPATKIVSDSVKINVAMNWYFIAKCHLSTSCYLFHYNKGCYTTFREYDASQANYDEDEETSSHITPTEKHYSGRTCHFFY